MINRLKNSLGILTVTTAALAIVGCGDGPTCPSDIVVVIAAPSGSLSTADDLDAGKAGIQQNVRVRTNLQKNDKVTLTVKDARTNGVSQMESTADKDGLVIFPNVTMPSGEVTLTVEASSDCGKGSDEIKVNVTTGSLCDLTFEDGPITNSFFAPVPVLNNSNDNDTDLADFQAQIRIASVAGSKVELFVLDVKSDKETSVGVVDVGAGASALFETTLLQGAQVIRAVCSNAGVNSASATSTVQVDTIVPTCTLTNPEEGVTVIPAHDQDAENDGIQFTWTGTVDHAGEDDVEGEKASFYQDTIMFAGSNVDNTGASASLTMGEFGAPGSYPVRFETQDHAGNACIGSFSANVIMEGCAIEIASPTDIVVSDSDANASNGLQSNFTVQVDGDCAGSTVFVDCGEGEFSVVAPANGAAVVENVTVSSTVVSEGNVTCAARVVSSDNFQTNAQRVIAFDTQAPAGVLGLAFPEGLQCGDTILRDVANDADGDLSNGLQITVNVTAPLADSQFVSVENSICLAPLPASCLVEAPTIGGNVNIDLAPGTNDVRAVTRDSQGNEGQTPPCLFTVADIGVTILDPVGSGSLGLASAGLVVNGSNAEITVCATSSEADVTATLELDNGASVPMSLNGSLGAFCTDSAVVMSEGVHEIVVIANANVGTRQGMSSVNVTVDLSAPDMPAGLTAISPNHQQIRVAWNEVLGASGYILKYSTSPFTDFPNQGVEVSGVGTSTSIEIPELNSGTTYYVAVVAVDEVGNRSGVASEGPVIPAYDGTGSIASPGAGAGERFGQSIVRGNFNNDEFDDIAVSAPLKQVGGNPFAGEVYIYFGSENGIANTPDVTISSNISTALFGFSLTRLNWSNSDGLAISAIYSNTVYVFHGDTLTSASSLTDSDADIRIVVDNTTNWFSNGFMGISLSSGQLDAMGTMEELIIGVPKGGTNSGGVAVIYGGVPNGDTIILSDSASAAMMSGMEGYFFENPVNAANGSDLGVQVAYLGDTRTGDGVGDFAVAYSADNQTPRIEADNHFYVLRGRIPSGTSGMNQITLGASDLEVALPVGAPTRQTAFGMQLGSIEDQNNDGFRDIVVSGQREGTGRVYIISGSRVGSTILNGTTDYLTLITGDSPGTPFFGAGIANNAIEENPDINGDGVEDLLLSGGQDGAGNNPAAFVWYGGAPSGNITASSADYIIDAPDNFTNVPSLNQPNALQIMWAGDINNNGMTDVCWADWSAESSGRMEILWDEQLSGARMKTENEISRIL